MWAPSRDWLAVGEHMPRLPARLLGASIFRWLDLIGAVDVSVETRVGRHMSARDFLIGQGPKDVARAPGVRRARPLLPGTPLAAHARLGTAGVGRAGRRLARGAHHRAGRRPECRTPLRP